MIPSITLISKPNFFIFLRDSSLSLVARVLNSSGGVELLLDRADVDEAQQQVLASSLVVGTRGTSTTEGLLANNGTSRLAVDVEVTSGVAELLLSEADSLAVGSEHGTSQAVLRGRVNELADLAEGVGGSVVVDVGGQDGAEELVGQVRVVGVGGLIDGGVDEVALGGVVGAAGDELEVLVVLGGVNGARQLLEGRLVDHGAHEVGVLPGDALLDGLGVVDELLLELGPDRLGHVQARGGTALLALVLKGAADGLDGGVVEVGRLVDQVEVLATGLTNNAGVGLVAALSNTLANGSVQLAEDLSATGVVEGSEVFVGEDGLGDLDGVTGDELDDVLGQTGLEEDLVDEIGRSDTVVTGLPQDDVAQQSRGTSQVTTNGGEVEGADGVDETLESAVLGTVPDTGGVVDGLAGVQGLGVVDTKAEEVCKLGGGVNLGLPGVLALAQHGGSHDLIAVLVGDEVGSLEEDGSAVGKGESLPGRLGSEGSLDGLVDVFVGGGMVVCHGGGVIGGVELLGDGGSTDLSRQQLALDFIDMMMDSTELTSLPPTTTGMSMAPSPRSFSRAAVRPARWGVPLA